MIKENKREMTTEELEAKLELTEKENEILTKKVAEMRTFIVKINEQLKKTTAALEEARVAVKMLESAE